MNSWVNQWKAKKNFGDVGYPGLSLIKPPLCLDFLKKLERCWQTEKMFKDIEKFENCWLLKLYFVSLVIKDIQQCKNG